MQIFRLSRSQTSLTLKGLPLLNSLLTHLNFHSVYLKPLLVWESLSLLDQSSLHSKDSIPSLAKNLNWKEFKIGLQEWLASTNGHFGSDLGNKF
jgi:hypothetical protein